MAVLGQESHIRVEYGVEKGSRKSTFAVQLSGTIYDARNECNRGKPTRARATEEFRLRTSADSGEGTIAGSLRVRRLRTCPQPTCEKYHFCSYDVNAITAQRLCCSRDGLRLVSQVVEAREDLGLTREDDARSHLVEPTRSDSVLTSKYQAALTRRLAPLVQSSSQVI